MKRFLISFLVLLSMALPMWSAVDGKFSYSYPPEDMLPYSLGYQYSTYDLGETDVEGWRVMSLTSPVTLMYEITSEEDRTVQVVFDPLYLELTDVVIPNKVVDSETGTEYTVTAIGKMAFDDCPAIRSVIMSDSIKRIEDYAFNMCENKILHNIGVIRFSKNLEHIGNYAFRNCHNLTTGHFTEGDQWPLQAVDFVRNPEDPIYGYGGRLTGLENYLLLPESVSYIGKHAFEGCYFLKFNEKGHFFPYGLSKVKIPNPSCVIDDYAFAGCEFLELVTIGPELTSEGLTDPTPAVAKKGRIGAYAFANCNLMRLDIPSSIESIGEYAFSNCFHRPTTHTRHLDEGRVYFDNLKWFYPRSLFDNYESFWGSWEIGTLLDVAYQRAEKYLNAWHTNTVTIHADNMTIGLNAFANNPHLTKLIINGTVDEIPSAAFKGCSNLTEVTLPEGLRKINSSAFMDCTELVDLVIPNDVTEIGDSTFYGCTKLKEIQLPANLQKVNPYLFYGCTMLTLSDLPSGVRSIGHNAFQGCNDIETFNIPDNVTEIGDYAFADCYIHQGLRVNDVYRLRVGLTQVTIGNGVKTIGAHAFDGDRHLGVIEMGPNVNSIGEYAFRNCMSCPESNCGTQNNEVILPDALTSIGVGAFEGCSHLPSVTLGEAVTSLPAYAFANCSELSWVEGLDHVETVELSTFAGCYSLEEFGDLYSDLGVIEDGIIYNEDFTEVIAALPYISEAIIQPTVTHIREGAFANCGALSYIEFPADLVSIGSRAFENCVMLDWVDLLNVEMGDSIYAGCTNIVGVYIPIDFNQPLRDNWFAGCYRMEEIYVEPGNELYMSDYGLLYDAEGKTLLRAPSGIYDVEILDTATAIGDYAFSNCIVFSSLDVPPSVTRIGAHAFDGCYDEDDHGIYYGFSEINFGNPAIEIGEYAFNNCKNLSAVVWDDVPVEPTGRIGKYAFNGCESLEANFDYKYFNLGDACISEIDPYAFAGFPGLQQIVLPPTLQTIGDHAFADCENLSYVEFQEGLKSIGNSAFRSTALKSLANLPNSIVEIGDSAFMDCSNVMAIHIPENLKKINPYTFYKSFSGAQYNEKPEEDFDPAIVIPDAVESIGDYAFFGGAVDSKKYYGESGHTYSSLYSFYEYGLQSVSIGNNVTSIGTHAFDGCHHLMEVNMGKSVKSIGDFAFRDCFQNTFNGVRIVELTLTGNFEDKFKNEVYWEFDPFTPAPLTLPEGLTSLGEYAFSGCAQMPGLTVPASLAEIPYQAFYGCAAIPELILPEGLTTIGDEAFGGCSGVKEIRIPASLQSASRAFVDCDQAMDVYYYAETPREFDEGFFSPKVYASKTADLHAPNAIIADIKGLTPWALFYRIIAKDETLVHLERALETKNGLKFRILSNKPSAYCEVAGPAEPATEPTSYVVPEYVLNTDETSDYFNVPYKVIRIGNDAFENDLNLVGITIPDNVYDIGQEAFNGCKNLPEINLPESITNIGERAFANCYALTYFVVPPQVTRLNAGVLQDCRGLYSIRMHDNIEELGKYSLMDCRHLRAFERSENWRLKVIDDYALKNCIELEVINIPEGVTKIGKEAMYYCQKLNTASLPKTLEELGENVFDDCEVLTTIKVYTEKTPKIRGEANLTEPHCKIYVQAKCLDDYRELWKVHEHRIEPGIQINVASDDDMPRYIAGSSYYFPHIMPLEGQTMTWSSTNPKVTTSGVNHDGNINLNAVGSSHIRVDTDQHFYHESDLDVYPQLADANWDSAFDISDAVSIANYVVENPQALGNWWKTGRTDITSFAEWMKFYSVGADVNDDGAITISDASAAVKIILNGDPAPAVAAATARRVRANNGPADALLIGALPLVASDSHVVALGLENSADYVALQADIRLPEGLTLRSVTPGPRAAEHAISTRRIDDRTTRVILFDINSNAFADSAEPLLLLSVDGETRKGNEIEVTNIIASDAAATSHGLNARSGFDITALKSLTSGNIEVTPADHGLTICNAAGTPIQIHTLDGITIRNLTPSSAAEFIPLPAGLYLITAPTQTFKILIH